MRADAPLLDEWSILEESAERNVTDKRDADAQGIHRTMRKDGSISLQDDNSTLRDSAAQPADLIYEVV